MWCINAFSAWYIVHCSLLIKLFAIEVKDSSFKPFELKEGSLVEIIELIVWDVTWWDTICIVSKMSSSGW